MGGQEPQGARQLVRHSVRVAGLSEAVVDVWHGLAGDPGVRGDGRQHVQGQPQVGVPVHVDGVVPAGEGEGEGGVGGVGGANPRCAAGAPGGLDRGQTRPSY